MSLIEETAQLATGVADPLGNYANEFSEYKNLMENTIHLVSEYATLAQSHAIRVLGATWKSPSESGRLWPEIPARPQPAATTTRFEANGSGRILYRFIIH